MLHANTVYVGLPSIVRRPAADAFSDDEASASTLQPVRHQKHSGPHVREQINVQTHDRPDSAASRPIPGIDPRVPKPGIDYPRRSRAAPTSAATPSEDDAVAGHSLAADLGGHVNGRIGAKVVDHDGKHLRPPTDEAKCARPMPQPAPVTTAPVLPRTNPSLATAGTRQSAVDDEVWPVVHPASSDNRNATAAADVAGLAQALESGYTEATSSSRPA